MKYWKVIAPILVITLAVAWYFFAPAVNFETFTQLLTGKPSATPSAFHAPAGFEVEIVAEGLNRPRVIAFDPKGRMVVSELGANTVTVFEKNAEGALVGRPLLEKLRSPHGIAFYTDKKTNKTYLYVAEVHQVARYAYDNVRAVADPGSAQNIATFSADGNHTTRTIGFGPNFRTTPIISGYLPPDTQFAEKLYVSVGSTCNVCVETSWKRGAILEADPEGTFLAEFAGGLRNAVFFAFHPKTGHMWATEMGRDYLGDNLPPDEINIVKVAVADTPFGARRYGWPFCYGKQVKDTTFKPEAYQRTDISEDCATTEPSYIDIPAHSAPLGLAFITDTAWPKAWQNHLLVAYHGSWNRTEPTGYKIVRFALDSEGTIIKDSTGKPVAEDFLTWLDGKKVLGRPVDLKFHDGSLFISDDQTGVIYKVRPTK